MKNTTKKEIISRMTVENGLTKKDNEKALNSMINAIVDAVADGEKVQITGFVTFDSVERAERIGRNPKTQEEIIIPAKRVPRVKIGDSFKTAVANI